MRGGPRVPLRWSRGLGGPRRTPEAAKLGTSVLGDGFHCEGRNGELLALLGAPPAAAAAAGVSPVGSGLGARGRPRGWGRRSGRQAPSPGEGAGWRGGRRVPGLPGERALCR